MCGVTLLEKRSSQQLMDLLGLKETLDIFAKANGVLWYGHVLRRDNDEVLRASGFEVVERRKRRRQKTT